ncbi:penicillin-binding protein 2 [Patescibacteria group bacterium]
MANPFKQSGVVRDKNLKVQRSGKEINIFEAETHTDNEDVQAKLEEPLSKKRVVLFSLVIPIVLILLAGRLFQLQILDGKYLLSLAEKNRIRTEIERPARGIIYDRNKEPLIKNSPSFDIVIVPSDLPKEEIKREKIYKKIDRISGVSIKKLRKIVNKKGTGFQDPVPVRENIPRKEALVMETKFSEIAGVRVEKNPTRHYLSGESFSHLIGYIGKINEQELENNKQDYAPNDYIGKIGLENSYEQTLKGKHGKKQVEVDSFGKTAKVISETSPVSGQNLILTIRKDLQEKMTEALQKGINSSYSQGGVAIAMNPKDGQVLGMVSLPDFDNNLFAEGISSKDYKSLSEDPTKPLFNRAINGTYPAGSVIKPFTASAGLEENVIDEWSTVSCKGTLDVENQYNPDIIYNFLCWLKSGHGLMNVRTAIEKSCDIFFYTVAGGFENFKGLGLEKLRHYFDAFGLGKKTEIDLPNETEGTIPDENWKREVKNEPWYIGDTYHMAIGQGDLLTTPLQIVNATSAVANGGTLFKPQLVYQVQDKNDKVKQDYKAKILNKNFVSDENLRIVQEGMRQVITSGTARNLGGISVSVAGKTGTAQYANNQKEHAWFTAFAPYEDPEICLVVLVEGGGEGNEVAVPVAQEILKWYFKNK